MKSNIELLGEIGEKIVTNYLSSMGYKIQESIDPYDNVKDLIANDLRIEVKTEQPFVRENSFSIRETQLKKCRNSDLIFVVSVPPLFDLNFPWGGWIFKIDPKKFETKNYTTKSGMKMILIPIEQPSVTAVKKLADEETNTLLRYTKSDYKRK